jgi:hypothetical protein
MKNVMASAGLLALGAVGVQSAHAQLMAGAEKPWSVSGTLRGFYDDNYNTAPDGPERRSSLGFELRPSVAVNLPLDQTTLNASYIYSMRYYDDRPKNKADHSHDFEVLLVHNFSERYSLDVSDSFVIAQEPSLIDPVNSLPIRSNGNNIRNDGAINFHATITPLLGIVLGYDNTLYDYDQSGPGSFAAELNRMEHLVILDTRWQIFKQTTGVVGYRFGAVDHTSNDSLNPNPLNLNPDPNFVSPSIRNNRSHAVYVGADHSFRRDLSGSVRVGVQYTDYYNDSASGTSLSPYVDLSLNYTYMDGGTLTLGFHDAHNQTDQTGFIPGGPPISTTGAGAVQDQESQVLYGTVVQKITPKLTGTLTGQFQNSTYVKGVLDGKADQFFLLGLNLTYQFTHYLSGEVGYNYDDLESDIPGRGYDRNRVYVGITGSY